MDNFWSRSTVNVGDDLTRLGEGEQAALRRKPMLSIRSPGEAWVWRKWSDIALTLEETEVFQTLVYA
jgi:hypothetical protein